METTKEGVRNLMETETVINLYDDSKTLFSNDKGMIGKLTRLGVPIVKQQESGTWFSLSDCTLTVKINKKRGIGQKEMEL